MTKISKDTVKHISKLANIPLTDKDEQKLADGFNKSLMIVDELSKVDVAGVEPTNQVTGLENVLRDDKVNENNMLSQEKALSNTKNKHNGYFVVDQILAEN